MKTTPAPPISPVNCLMLFQNLLFLRWTVRGSWDFVLDYLPSLPPQFRDLSIVFTLVVFHANISLALWFLNNQIHRLAGKIYGFITAPNPGPPVLLYDPQLCKPVPVSKPPAPHLPPLWSEGCIPSIQKIKRTPPE